MRSTLAYASSSIRIVPLLVAMSCATAGSDPDAAGTQPTPIPDAAPLQPVCGNSIIEGDEACDGASLGGVTCASLGLGEGAVTCTSNCELDTSSCVRCGDGNIGGAEQCDGANLAGATCASLGFAGGTLTCTAACSFNTNACIRTENLQNHNGICNLEIGCSSSDGSGTSGNPQNMVECFGGATLPPPFRLTRVAYAVGQAEPPPDALNLEVYSWTGSGAPGTRIANIPLGVADLAGGPHTITLASPVQISTADFCVGIAGSATNDGFRLAYSSNASAAANTSWIKAPTCGSSAFVTTASVVEPGNWCISATIEK